MLEHEFVVIVACSDDLSDAVYLNEIATNIQSLQFDIFLKTFADG